MRIKTLMLLCCRLMPAVLVFMVTNAINAREKSAAGAPTTASVRTAPTATGSVVATKASTAQRAKTASRDATAPIVPKVSQRTNAAAPKHTNTTARPKLTSTPRLNTLKVVRSSSGVVWAVRGRHLSHPSEASL